MRYSQEIPGSEFPGRELIIQHTGQALPLGKETITIGRQQDNILVLADPRVSPHHARISWQAPRGVYTIEDLGSVEGTYVNELRIEGPQNLRHGDILRLGNTVMELRQPPPLSQEWQARLSGRCTPRNRRSHPGILG